MVSDKQTLGFWGYLRRLRSPFVLLISVIILGTLGYYLLWRSLGGSWLDAVYMTFITITTVGYNEIYPLDSSGRILTIFISITGIGSLFYVFSATMEYLVIRQLQDPSGRRKMQEKINKLEDHTILAGLGRMGQQAARELAQQSSSFVIIDHHPPLENLAKQEGYLYIIGDATEDEVLEQAGVKRAKNLIAAAGDDASNAFIVMSARALNPNLVIVARADNEAAIKKLLKAGANRALDPYSIGGRRLVNLVLRPAAIDFLETTMKRGQQALGVQDIEVQDGSDFDGKSLRQLDIRRRFGVTVLAVLREGKTVTNPSPDFVLKKGDQIISLGMSEQLEKLGELEAEKL